MNVHHKMVVVVLLKSSIKFYFKVYQSKDVEENDST